MSEKDLDSSMNPYQEETKPKGYIKQLQWDMAIGLQQVDNLKPSKYLEQIKEKNVLGTYLHGIFDEKEFLLNFINDIRETKGLNIIEKELLDYRVYKLNQYDELAKIFEENINIRRIINI